MTGPRIHSNSDRTSVALPAGVRAATASPQAVAAPFPTPASNPPAPALAGLASAGLAFSSDCIGDDDQSIDALIAALLADWCNAGIIMNHMTLRSCALSEIDASMPRIKPDVVQCVIPIGTTNNLATGKHHAD
jgi:hypothetical protein